MHIINNTYQCSILFTTTTLQNTVASIIPEIILLFSDGDVFHDDAVIQLAHLPDLAVASDGTLLDSNVFRG